MSEEGDEGAEGLGDEEESADDEFNSDDEALDYINSSKALQVIFWYFLIDDFIIKDEDESEDYVAEAKAAAVTNGGEKKNGSAEAKETVPKVAENNRVIIKGSN